MLADNLGPSLRMLSIISRLFRHLVQSKCCINSCWCVTNSSFAFWNFLEFFFFCIVSVKIQRCRTWRYWGPSLPLSYPKCCCCRCCWQLPRLLPDILLGAGGRRGTGGTLIFWKIVWQEFTALLYPSFSPPDVHPPWRFYFIDDHWRLIIFKNL